MNKIYQKLSMAALSAAMVAAPAINVFAAPEDIIDTSKKATLTIHKYDITAAQADGVIPKDNPEKAFKTDGTKDADAEKKLEDYKIKGVQFSYQKVGDICTETVAGKIQVMYVIPPELQTILGLTTTRDDNKYTSDEINDALKTALADNTVTKNKLEDYIRGGHGTTSMPLTDEDGVSQATNLPLGLYLIVETEVPANVHTTVDPFFVSLPMTDLQGTHWFYDVDVYPKNQTNIPTLDKLVRQQDDAVDHNKPEYLDSTTVSEEEIANYISVVLPEEMSKLTIEKGKDYCTLVTCTPYGVNTHRLLVRGIRIPYTEQKELVAKEETSNTHSQWMEEYTKSIIIAAIAFITLLVILIVWRQISSNKKRKRKKKRRKKRKKKSPE